MAHPRNIQLAIKFLSNLLAFGQRLAVGATRRRVRVYQLYSRVPHGDSWAM